MTDAPLFEIRLIPAIDLKPYGKNSRKHSPEQVRQIRESMLQWGWTNPVLVDCSAENEVIAGHGRLMAAVELLKAGEIIKTPGGKPLPPGLVPVIDCTGWTPEQRRAYVIADNKLAENASWDMPMLKAELLDLREAEFDLSKIGFLPAELADLLDPPKVEPKCDPDDLPENSVEPFSVVGDIWICGAHRVMCGDSTSFEHVEKLLGGASVSVKMVATDPPYLMDYTGSIGTNGEKRQRHDAIKNDKLSKEDGERFLRDIMSMIKAKCEGAFYVCFYRKGIEWLMRATTDVGLEWRNLIIWRKNNFNLSNSDYKSQYEPVLFGWNDDYIPVLYGWKELHLFRGPKGQSDVIDVDIPSVWDINKTKKNEIHPTVKPTALIERMIENSSLPGDTVLDLFGGSGTTLVACEITGRAGRLMELDPTYCDVIVRRYAKFTGKVPVHAETGEPFPLDRFGELPEQK